MNEINPNYAPWVKKLLVLKLFNPGASPNGSWMDHKLLIHKERRGQLVGSLDREVIQEMRTKWFETAMPYLDNPSVSDADRNKLRKDLDAVKWAGICLDRLGDHDSQSNPFIPDEAIQGDTASGENDEASRGATLEPAGNVRELDLQFAQIREQAPQSTEFAVEEQSQPEPALPPAAPLSRAQESEARDPSTEGLVDPAFIRTREQFIEACKLASQRINDAETLWEAKREAAVGEMLETLASTAELSEEFEMMGKAVRLRAYFKAAKLKEEFHLANGQNGQKIFDDTAERLMRDLVKFTEEAFEAILVKGLRDGNLAERLFRVSASGSTRGTSQKIAEMDPRRFFLAFICDLRTNPSSYNQTAVLKLLEDQRIVENFGPVYTHFMEFSIALVGAWKARTQQQVVPQESTRN